MFQSPLSKSGFTLIELLLAVTLSAILMTGIVVFVSSSLGSNMATKKVLEEGNGNEQFEQHLTEALGNVTGSGLYATGTTFIGEYLTGIFLETGGPNPPITFLGLRTQTGYCDSYSGTASETGTVLRLVLRQFSVPIEQNNAPGYTLSSSGNSIFSGATRIIGTGYPGNALTNSGLDTELSSPSALISSGTYLYISDTMNDRVLSYNITSGSITQLLGPENDIRRPTSLSFSGGTLLIASSGNGKIYNLQDGDSGNGSVFSGTFRVANNFSADNLKFTFSGISSLSSPTSPASFTLSGVGITQNIPNDLLNTGANLQYTFTGGAQSFSTGNTYTFTVNNILPLPTTFGNNTVQIDFLSGSILQYSDTFHYYSKGDGTLESSTGNILKTLSEGIIYPHNIVGPTAWSGTIDWNSVLGQNPTGEEISSSLPIQDFSFQTTGKILSIRYHEYKNYDCMLGKHQVEERIKKVLLR
ncbi:MAG: prepilin-type N-terminal cleavage/methylation domain-containing protein [Candidatus Gracilibacteria bacterium]|nr:prepilin-type N-terminal cleavage/methylation domain-containing protein [Candidatus Gracilibacteria bacterium]